MKLILKQQIILNLLSGNGLNLDKLPGVIVDFKINTLRKKL